MSEFFLANPFSGLLLTLGCYWFGQFLYHKTGWTLLQPILTSAIIIIIFLTMGNIPYEAYYDQNAILNYILPLTAVVLALPLYRNLHILKKYALPIMAGIITGTVVTMGSILLVGKLMGTDISILISMLPKSATNPIALEVSQIIGGIPSFTVAMVVITGVFGGVLGPELLNLFRIRHEVARGIALGSMSHAVGTARAFKESEIEGSMSSLAMAIAGMLTAILSPLFVLFL
ncbi:LrgB family protein [Sinanaerobacter chloroacetimidivorans]|jgi:predicted murein hydrolase (TIGR00659 family)|uniref:LrgB family protein n=1 Tax=Sinanaerobacter chloroacetimidivorans TaxID=2818044 RepID=A0A8J7VY70_9FIRM|nr:LrgB family protein [Sinanaerobacter chloroacetimidivorans]MBR0597209.1 LrgB family protein [Sinanaerobacter chloroacetimidivorans]